MRTSISASAGIASCASISSCAGTSSRAGASSRAGVAASSSVASRTSIAARAGTAVGRERRAGRRSLNLTAGHGHALRGQRRRDSLHTVAQTRSGSRVRHVDVRDVDGAARRGAGVERVCGVRESCGVASAPHKVM